MDIFTEQLAKKPLNKTDYVFFSVVISFVILFFWISIAFFKVFSVWFMVLIVFVAVKLISLRFVEFEYVVTNGNVTIDKIIAKRSRKNVISFELSTVDKFYKYHNGMQIQGAKKIYNLQTSRESWCTCFFDSNVGNIAVIFSPNKKTLDAIVPFLRRQVARDVFGGN